MKNPVGKPLPLTLLGGVNTPIYDKAQKGQRISRHGPEKGAVNKRDTTVELVTWLENRPNRAHGETPCRKVVSGGDPPSERENPLHYIPPSLIVDDPVEQRKSELGNPAHTHRR